MHTNSDEKVFYMKNHLLEKLHPNPQKPNRIKVMGLSRSSGKKNQKISNLLVAHRGCGAPLVTEKKIVLNFFSKNDT